MSNHSEDINKYLNYREKIYYTANYDVLAVNKKDNTITVPCNMSGNTNGYNLCVSRFAYCEDIFKKDCRFLWEQYTIASFDYSLLYREGQIDFTGLYPDGNDLEQSTGVSTNKVQVFNVDSGSGLYKNIHKVLIDFRKPVRVIYFVGWSDFAPK